PRSHKPTMKFILSIAWATVVLVAFTFALPTPAPNTINSNTPSFVGRSVEEEKTSLQRKTYERGTDTTTQIIPRADSTVVTIAKTMFGLTKRQEELVVRTNDVDVDGGLAKRNFFKNLWKGIKDIGKKAWDGAKTIMSNMPPIIPIRRSVDEEGQLQKREGSVG
ncbi:hypothetical protein H0H93_000609, partial [Arthromyces matolae]